MYVRLGCGQFEEVARLFCCDLRSRQGNALSVEHCLDQAKRLLLSLQCGTSYSICSYDVPVSYRLAWDMHQVIQHHVSWEAHPEGGNTENFNEPMNVSEIPFCTIETVVGSGHLIRMKMELSVLDFSELCGMVQIELK